MNMLTKEYWENRYINQEIGWDVGEITTPLKTYIDQLENKKLRILIPGGGNSYVYHLHCGSRTGVDCNGKLARRIALTRTSATSGCWLSQLETINDNDNGSRSSSHRARSQAVGRCDRHGNRCAMCP
jgi:hypothetical protein